ncbi:hypothetical protein [Caloranaerobacter sp. DY30410]|uniref:hypothetical protein n=1 Tax=Caloranaerobacter sp. DY30410 TaxID=3238305 RepID=UPI003CFD0C4F
MNLYDMITKVVRKVLREEHPDLESIHYPVIAEVTKVYNDSELVDVRILDKYGNIDSRFPEIPRVKTQNKYIVDEIVISNKNEITVDTYYGTRQVSFPEYLIVEAKINYNVGDKVRLGFYYNDLSMPYVDGKVD